MGIRLGGNIADYPEPHKLCSEDPDYKRDVRVSVTSWIGIGIGAKHWYVTIEEEDDMIWDEEDQYWVKCWDHPDKYKGRHFSEQFIGEADAKSWARMIVAKHFSDGSHNVRDESGTPWMYDKEGD
jgi:hypothetical protein